MYRQGQQLSWVGAELATDLQLAEPLAGYCMGRPSLPFGGPQDTPDGTPSLFICKIPCGYNFFSQFKQGCTLQDWKIYAKIDQKVAGHLLPCLTD
jgi:hypothetical protein